MQETKISQDGVPEEADASSAMLQLQPQQQPMSKNQMKKIARLQRMLDSRKERRKIEKEKKKLKKKELAKLRQDSGDDPHVAINTKKTRLMSESGNKFRVVIDMDFEDYMTDAEIGKAAKQVGRIYSLNRHSERPCQLYITSLKGRIRDRFGVTNAGYLNWDVNISQDDYLTLFGSNDTQENSDRDNIIYLTADTDKTLPSAEDLLKDESKIFVIGGLVDHNRHKKLCFERAEERKITTAKLPIKDHVQLCQRHILSTVTVFEILLNVVASRMSWRDALIASIPKRKLALNVSEETHEGGSTKTIGDIKVANPDEPT